MYENSDFYLFKNDSVGETMNESRFIHFPQKCIGVSEYLDIAMTALGRGNPHLHRGDAGYELRDGGGVLALLP